MKNKQKGFIVPLLIVIIAVLVIGGGVFWYASVQKNNTTPNDAWSPIGITQSTTTPQSPVATTTVNQIAGWKTYTNTQYGFSIEYPQDWAVSSKLLSFVDSLDISKSFGTGSQGYTCSSDINLISTSVFDQNAYSYNSAKILGWQATTPTINNHSIVEWTNSTNFPGTFAYYVKNANSQYSYGINDSAKTSGVYNQSTGVWTTMPQNIYVKECADIFSQMISTLKFTN